MNGGPLPAIHGAPVRIVAPGYIGARSVKGLQRITVHDEPSDNFFQTSTYRLLPPDIETWTQAELADRVRGPGAVWARVRLHGV